MTAQSPALDFDAPFQFVQRGETVLTFANAAEVHAGIRPDLQIVSTDTVDTESLLRAQPIARGSGEINPRHLLLDLLRASWENWIETRGLGVYQLANRRRCAFFKPGSGTGRAKSVVCWGRRAAVLERAGRHLLTPLNENSGRNDQTLLAFRPASETPVLAKSGFPYICSRAIH